MVKHYKIFKITSDHVVDFAAEELKKYLRMMMPEGGDVKIAYAPDAKDGFRLGLMQDFALSVSEARDTALDDIIYIDCDTEGGIIAGKYSDGKNWGATSGYKAEVTKVGEEATLTLTNVDKPEDVSVYEQCTIPSDVKGATVKMTTRGEEMFEVVRFL